MAELTKNMSQMFQGEAEPAAAASSISDLPVLSTQEESDFKAFFEQMLRSSAQGSEVSEDELQDTLKEMETRLKSVNLTVAQEQQASPSSASTAGPTSFQDSVKQTYEKLKASDATARVSLGPWPDCSSSDSKQAEMDASQSMAQDPLAAMFAQLESSMGIDDPSIQETLEAMMGQLMSKELLYEPINDLNSKVCLGSGCLRLAHTRAVPRLPQTACFDDTSRRSEAIQEAIKTGGRDNEPI
jgi:hypothetical protein